MNLQGIDISYWQGNNVDFKKVKAAGKSFVFLRCGVTTAGGSLKEDSTFKSNVQKALAAGLNVGVYVYAYYNVVDGGKTAAKEVLELIKPYKINMPIVLDIESTKAGEPNGTPYDTYTKGFNSALCDAFLSTIENAGYYAMLYTYKSFANNYLDMAALKNYDFWLAEYAAKPTYTGNYSIWQYSGSGKVDGITGDCDLNVSYKDHAAIIEAAGLNNLYRGNDLDDKSEEMSQRVAVLEDALTRAKAFLATL